MFPPFPWSYSKLAKGCKQRWGVAPRTGWLDTLFGGHNLSQYSNIIFSNGLLDPWHGGGQLSNVSDSVRAIVLPLGAHHLDMRGGNKMDPPCATQARLQEISLISEWLRKAARGGR